MDKKQYIEAGRIVNTHGVRGEVKIEVWLDSAEFLRSFKRVFIGEREIKIGSAFVHKGFLIAKLEGVDDVNTAMTFKGREISITARGREAAQGRVLHKRHYRRFRRDRGRRRDRKACGRSGAPRVEYLCRQGRDGAPYSGST